MHAPLPRPLAAFRLRFADFLFVCLVALYCLLIWQGIVPLSGNGAMIDSDLQTYAQGMAASAQPNLFGADPVLHSSSPANSIPNLERWLAIKLAQGDDWAAGLLRAGCIAIFCFYAGWYFLGRWLFQAPALAALLALVCGITVWVGWGTFWGIAHSDPVPRVFFAAIFPFILWLAFAGLGAASIRYAACFSAGCAIWIHGISALNCGAMILACYLLIPVPDTGMRKHLLTLAFSTLAFLAPVVVFLWPSLSQEHKFGVEELRIFHDLFNLRWQEDYGHFSRRLADFFSPRSAAFPILLGACAGWIAIFFRGVGRTRLLCKTVPAFVFGLFTMAFICWAESAFAPRFGRLPMGHELIRGLRFLVPLAWLMCVGGIGAITGKWLRRLILAGCVLAIIPLAQDRQHQAAIYAFQHFTGLKHSEKLANEAREAADLRAVFDEVGALVPAGQAIYSPVDAMQIRYIAKRPLAHSFKDGYIFFYNKDVEGSRRWLKLEKAAHEEDGILKAWKLSEAPWLLCPEKMLPESSSLGNVIMRKNGWLLLNRKKGSL